MSSANSPAGEPAPTPRTPRHLVAGGVSWPWALVAAIMICVIWGNSLVPGTESGNLSGGVLAMLQTGLADLGLPWEWLTDHIVRKTAHFTEYLVLALVVMQALRPHRPPAGKGPQAGAWPLARRVRAALTPLVLVAVPTVDELVIQRLCTWGRSGQVSDILLDCCGALVGVALTLLVSRLVRGRRQA